MTPDQMALRRFRDVAQRYAQTTGHAPPPLPREAGHIALVTNRMLDTIRGNISVEAGPAVTLGTIDVTIALTHAEGGSGMALVTARDAEGHPAKVLRLPLTASELSALGQALWPRALALLGDGTSAWR